MPRHHAGQLASRLAADGRTRGWAREDDRGFPGSNPGCRRGRVNLPPRVGIVGLGYMGLATGLSFAAHGLPTVGYDISADRRETVRAGRSPFYERGLAELLAQQRGAGKFNVVDHLEDLARGADIAFICVPTPSSETGAIDLSALGDAARSLAVALQQVSEFRVIAVKSTVVPGTTETFVRPLIESVSGKGPE